MTRWTVVFDRETLEKISVQETDGDIYGILYEPTLLTVHVETETKAHAISFVKHEDGGIEFVNALATVEEPMTVE